MHCSPARWTRLRRRRAACAAGRGFAQTHRRPHRRPRHASRRRNSRHQPQTAAVSAHDTKVDAAAAKQHLSEARDTLSQLTSMPEAAKLQGDARTQVSQLISSFND